MRGWECKICHLEFIKEREVIAHIESKHPISSLYGAPLYD